MYLSQLRNRWNAGKGKGDGDGGEWPEEFFLREIKVRVRRTGGEFKEKFDDLIAEEMSEVGGFS